MTLPPDWNEFIGLLCSHRVRFLIEPTEPDARRLGAALAELGFPAVARAWRRPAASA